MISDDGDPAPGTLTPGQRDNGLVGKGSDAPARLRTRANNAPAEAAQAPEGYQAAPSGDGPRHAMPGRTLLAELPRRPAAMGEAGWIDRLQVLAARLPALGVGTDLAALAAADLWGLYRFLLRVAGSD